MRSIKDKKEIRRSKRSKFSTKKSSVCDLPSNIFVATLANFQFEIKLFRIYLAVPVPPVDALSSMSLPPGVVDRWILWKKSRVAGWNPLELHAPVKYKAGLLASKVWHFLSFVYHPLWFFRWFFQKVPSRWYKICERHLAHLFAARMGRACRPQFGELVTHLQAGKDLHWEQVKQKVPLGRMEHVMLCTKVLPQYHHQRGNGSVSSFVGSPLANLKLNLWCEFPCCFLSLNLIYLFSTAFVSGKLVASFFHSSLHCDLRSNFICPLPL